MLPLPLRDSYDLQSLIVRNQRSEVWLVSDRGGKEWVVKLSIAGNQPDVSVLAALSERPQARTCLVLPTEWGFADDRRFFQVSPYFPGRSMDRRMIMQYRNGAARLLECRSFVGHVTAALEVIHQPNGGGRRVVHSNLKPSNILWGHDPIRGSVYLLADFDAAHFEDSPNSRYSVGYAAPEVFAGSRGPAADYWALGIVVLEWLSGAIPFPGLDDASIRRLLGTILTPDIGEIAQEDWRTLLLGLLDNDPASRWGPENIHRWLSGESASIGAGLARGGESRAAEPFYVRGTPVFSARSLASALLGTWATELIQEDQLPAWLESRLGRPDMAAQVRTLLADSSLTQDIKLLNLCFDLNPELPPTWRGHTLTADNIDAIASQAQRGNHDNYNWLHSLLDGQCFDFYRSREDKQTGQLGLTMLHAWNDYQAAWSTLAAAGAPPLQQPPETDALPMVVRATFSSEVAADLRTYAQRLSADPMLLFGENWIRCLGTPLTAVSLPRLLVLRQFIPEVPEAITTADIPAPGTVGDDGILIWNRTQQRLWSWFRVHPDAEVVDLQPGETFPRRDNYRPIQHWDATRTAIGQAVIGFLKRALNWLLLRIGRQPIVDDPGIVPEFRVKLLALDAIKAADINKAPSLVEAHLALISWNSPHHHRLKLCIGDMGTFLPSGRLKTPPLPARGRYLIVLTGNTRIWFEVRRRWFSLGQRSRPVSIWFSEPTPLLGVSKEIMLGVRDKLMDIGTQTLVQINDAIRAPETMSSLSVTLTRAGNFDPAPPDWRTALIQPRRLPPGH